MSNNKKIIICLVILCIIVFTLGIHGGTEYYFRDFCVHKTLNMFYNNGSPVFFKKPSFVSDMQALPYWIFYLILKHMHVVYNFDNFVRLFTTNYISTPVGNISFMLPGLIVNNIFAAIGVCFTFLTTYILTNKKLLPAIIAGFLLATADLWMSLSHHLAVDIPLSALSVTTMFFSIYFIQNKESYSLKNIIILGVLSGLCAATKYNGALIIIAPIVALFITKKSVKDFIKNIVILFFFAGTTFLITNPHILIHLKHFLSDFGNEYKHAFYYGHRSADDKNPFSFHIFHSIPNAIGTLQFIAALIGMLMFCKDKHTPDKIKYVFFAFPVIFYVVMGISKLVFLRYILPLIPVLTICFGLFVHYARNLKPHKILYSATFVIISCILIQNSVNAIQFYKIMNYEDTRRLVKDNFKELNIDIPKNKIFYSDIFSNPYYEEDFINAFPGLKSDIKKFLDSACNSSIYIVPRRHKWIFDEYDILFFDAGTYDRPMLTQKNYMYSDIDNQYFMYYPRSIDNFKVFRTNRPLYVAQINPFNIDKTKIPFDLLRNNFKYRKARGPFVEVYFSDKQLRDRFVQNCKKHSLECESLELYESYYYNNLTPDFF